MMSCHASRPLSLSPSLSSHVCTCEYIYLNLLYWCVFPEPFRLAVHKSRVLGEWSNMIGYEMGSSSVGGLNYNQDFSDAEF